MSNSFAIILNPYGSHKLFTHEDEGPLALKEIKETLGV